MRLTAAILIGLLIIALAGCTTQLQRDAKRLGKIKTRSPELFKTEIDTIFIKEPVDSIGMIVETDTAAFIQKLKEYELVTDSLRNMVHRFDEASLQDRRVLFATKQRLTQELFQGAFIPTDGHLIEKNGRFHLMVRFDPKAKTFSLLEGSTFNERVITKRETVTIRMKPTTKEALLSLWPFWTILLVIAFLVLAFKFLIK